MYYAAIKTLDIANGPGLRTTLFVPAVHGIVRSASSPKPGISNTESPLPLRSDSSFWTALPRSILPD